jgi:hypothetical protein
MNKRGVGVDDFIPLFILIFFFFFFVAFLFITGNNQADAVEMQSSTLLERIVSHDILVNYLNEKDESRQSKADDLIDSASKGQLENKRMELEAYFDPIFYIGGSNSWRSWGILISVGESEAEIKSSKVGTNQGGLDRRSLAHVVIPISAGKNAKIELFKRGRSSGLDPQPLEMP